MSKVVFVRPGMTESGRAGRKLGQANEALLPEECERLRRRAEQGVYPPIGRLYACPELRCRETARLVYPKVPPIMFDELAAFDCGEFEGLTQEQLNQSEIYLNWASAPVLPNCPGGENLNWYAAQCLKTLRSIVNEMELDQLEAVGVVAHRLAIDQIVQRVCLPRTRYQDLPLSWGAAVVLEIHSEQFTGSVTEIR
jgi:alpha-ribazole phosphatase